MASSSSQYLACKTEALASQSPVSPSEAQAAQIPLQSFNLPTFPPEAFTANLGTLILTSDINPDEYSALLEAPFAIPPLPPSIHSLSLELFVLGYPPGFLSALAARLPALRSLTLYSQLLAGTTPASREDALSFLRDLRALRELHLLDVYADPPFVAALADALGPDLRFVELSFTFRHSDPRFVDALPAAQVPALIRKKLLGLTMCVAAPDVRDDEEDREGTEVGVRPVTGRDAVSVVEKLVQDGEALVMLDATMFELSVADVRRVLDRLTKLRVLNVTVELTRGWEKLWEMMLRGTEDETVDIEVLEIVGVPGEEMVEKLKSDGAQEALLVEEDLERLGAKWKALKSLKASILRTRVEEWVKKEGVWEKVT